MRWVVRVGLAVLVVVGGGVVLDGCGGDGGEEKQLVARTGGGQPVPGGTAVVALANEPDVLNSLVRTSAVAGMVLSLLQASLAEIGEDLRWYPMIATGWEVAADSLAITYQMRPWLWEDGQPLTSADVCLSFELMRDPRIGSPRADHLRAVVDCEALDPATVRYRFATSQAHPVQATAHSIQPAHRVRDLDRTAVASWTLNRAPVASGPFRLVAWQSGRQLVLGPNPNYPLAAPWLQRVVLRILPDETARILALETGEVDVVADIPAPTANRLAGSETIVLREVTSRVFGFVMWNVRRPVLHDSVVRRAMSLAIDRGRIVDDLLGGFGEPAASYLPPVLWNHHHGLAPDPWRPDSARTLLSAAGWQDSDGDGVRERAGAPLRLELLYRGGDAQGDNAAAIVRQNLRDVGVAVELRAMELGTALEFLRAGRFDAYLGEYQANLYADPTPLVGSGATDRFNFGGYANAKVDSLLALAIAETDLQRSLPLWFELQTELALDQPAAILYYLRQVVAVNRRIRDARPNVLSPLNNLAEWWIAPEDRRWAAVPE